MGATKPDAPRANVFTVPAGTPFLDALARAVLAGELPQAGGPAPDPLALPGWIIYLPTRRAVRGLQQAFLEAGGGRAMLLPQIRAVADGQDDLGLLERMAGATGTAEAAEENDPEAIGELERRLVLAELVVSWSRAMRRQRCGPDGALQPYAAAGAENPAHAAHLATDLARLMDAVETEGVSLAGLEKLVPDALSQHWQTTLEFLKIVTEFWPRHLRERKLVSPAELRNRRILREAERLAHAKLAAPVIVAGVMGSIPAVAALVRAVAGRADGAIVLPALDQHLDEPSWSALASNHPAHPQSGLSRLLARLERCRSDVHVLAGAEITPVQALRNRIVSEALRPPGTTGSWRTFIAATDRGRAAEALAGLSLVEAPTAQDEAEVVALVLRQAAETPGRTAALVTPDRILARRVAIRLRSWNIHVDDSAGRPFAKTVPGAFLDLVANAAASDFAPPDVLALLKHPLTRLGLPAATVRRAARTLELAAFRATYLGRGLAGVAAALERAAAELRGGSRRHRAVRLLSERSWTEARDLIARLESAFAPLTELTGTDAAVTLARCAAAHIAAAEALALPPPVAATENSPLWMGEAGEAARRLFTGLADPTLVAPELRASEYADFYRGLLMGESVRPGTPVHPRLFIWGPLEARLQQPDVLVLGGLNDGTWPAIADPGAWLNRPMRQDLGLPAPEQETGRAAHDVATFLGAPLVYLTRAQKIDGVPSVPSRWLMRLNALLGGFGLADALEPGSPWLAWARARDAASRHHPIKPPAPVPALSLRPRRASVSEIETWLSNPYAIYARRILDLEPLAPVGAEPGAADKGQIVHEALSRFVRRHPAALPADVAGELRAIAREVLHELAAHPRVAAFWLPRLARFADWFAETEPRRRQGISQLLAEVEGAQVIGAPAGPFTLRARADRIDMSPTGTIVTDYKTGAVPNDTAVRNGLAPQLPLEAAIASAGGFAGVAAGAVSDLRYIRATGAYPPGEEHSVSPNGGTVTSIAASALAGLVRLVARFDDPATPYRAVRRPRFKYHHDAYAHLARVAEWAEQNPDESEGTN